jgi:predicted nucleic acid-binding protein
VTAALPFLDTNILIRHLAGDHPDQSPRCRDLLGQLETGARSVWTSHLVVAEVVYVLVRVYQFDRQRVADVLLPLIELPGLRIARKRLFRRVFELFATTALTYPDCYHAALVERSADRRVISFDRGFDRLPNVERIEP